MRGSMPRFQKAVMGLKLGVLETFLRVEKALAPFQAWRLSEDNPGITLIGESDDAFL